ATQANLLCLVGFHDTPARAGGRRSALARDGALPGQLHRAQARSYMMCSTVTDGSHSHACNASAKQAKLRRLV
ncbi:hypothetical protein, partial [Xanthomonas campestris]|uniref:hypothetical protein n=1 Tax=Xanthomonas campestris TaxID=339 RepID=UPI0032E3858D